MWLTLVHFLWYLQVSKIPSKSNSEQKTIIIAVCLKKYVFGETAKKMQHLDVIGIYIYIRYYIESSLHPTSTLKTPCVLLMKFPNAHGHVGPGRPPIGAPRRTDVCAASCATRCWWWPNSGQISHFCRGKQGKQLWMLWMMWLGCSGCDLDVMVLWYFWYHGRTCPYFRFFSNYVMVANSRTPWRIELYTWSWDNPNVDRHAKRKTKEIARAVSTDFIIFHVTLISIVWTCMKVSYIRAQ